MLSIWRLIPTQVIILAAGCLPGCISFATHSYELVDVRVLDAETSDPLSNARVSIFYGAGEQIVLNQPDNVDVTTDRHGRAAVEVTDYNIDVGVIGWEVSAEGYLTRHAGDPFSGRVPDEFLKEATDHDASLEAEIRLYRAPRASVTIVVPDGYRGPLKIEHEPKSDWVQEAIGQREFEFSANDDGYVFVEASPMLAWGVLSGVSVRYADGTEIQRIYTFYEPEKDNDIGLRTIGTYPRYRDLYVIGTKSDEESLRGLVHPPQNQGEYSMEALDVIFKAHRSG